ncbi:MAG: hypothetical protein ACK4KV_05615 [Rhodocyclaceae bacterium]
MRTLGLILCLTGLLMLGLLGIFYQIEHRPLARDGMLARGQLHALLAVHQRQGRYEHRVIIDVPAGARTHRISASVDRAYAARLTEGAPIAVFFSPTHPTLSRAGPEVDRLARDEIDRDTFISGELAFMRRIAYACAALLLLGAAMWRMSGRRPLRR